MARRMATPAQHPTDPHTGDDQSRAKAPGPRPRSLLTGLAFAAVVLLAIFGSIPAPAQSPSGEPTPTTTEPTPSTTEPAPSTTDPSPTNSTDPSPTTSPSPTPTTPSPSQSTTPSSSPSASPAPVTTIDSTTTTTATVTVGNSTAPSNTSFSPTPTSSASPTPDTGSFHGRWVTFDWQRSTCTLLNYTIGGDLVFRSIRGNGPCLADEHVGDMAGIRLFNANGSIRAHDVPNGLIRFHVYAGTITFQRGPDVTVEGQGRERDLVVRESRIHVLPTSPLGTLLWTADGFTANDTDGNIMLRSANPVPTMREPEAVQQAVHKGRVAGEITIDQAAAQGHAPPTVLPYDDVAIQLSRPNQSAFRLTVEADLEEGQTIVAHFGKGVVKPGEVSVVYYIEGDDGVMVPGVISQAADLEDVLDARPGEGTEYWIVEDQQGTHVLLAVPHWSIHVFDVLGLPPQYVPVLVYGVVLSGLFVGVAAVGAFLSRRNA